MMHQEISSATIRNGPKPYLFAVDTQKEHVAVVVR
jgi:hypothetical protein